MDDSSFLTSNHPWEGMELASFRNSALKTPLESLQNVIYLPLVETRGGWLSNNRSRASDHDMTVREYKIPATWGADDRGPVRRTYVKQIRSFRCASSPPLVVDGSSTYWIVRHAVLGRHLLIGDHFE